MLHLWTRIYEYIDLATNEDPVVLSLDDNMMGYTLKDISVALWSMWHCGSFNVGLLTVAYSGCDTDTGAADSYILLERHMDSLNFHNTICRQSSRQTNNRLTL